ncbi:MAG TPA: threonine/serine dehydratase [Bacillota bacterium]|nr:threonine/serine dehydratase [Bacillota bacterium]
MISVADVKEARKRISPIIHETPIFQSTLLSKLCGNNVFLKGEHLQKTGSFKIRGATNKVKVAVEEGAKLLTTASSGNHGQAVAYIANELNVPATIVVPKDINSSKEAAIQAYQGEVEKCGMTSNERLPRAKQIAVDKEGVYVPPYDDPYIIAGQGTIALELLEQIDHIDMILIPIGGGGLVSGILTAIKQLKPEIQVIGVEPEIAKDTYLSLQKGEITSIEETTSIADGLRTSQPGDVTFPIIHKYIDDIVLVSENSIKQAMFLALERTKQLIEPSSAVTIAAAMYNKINVSNKNVVCVISGGNVDLQNFRAYMPN